MPKNRRDKKTAKPEAAALTPQEKFDKTLKYVSVFLGCVIVLVTVSYVIDNYQRRWRHQQEMASVTTEINKNQTFNNKAIVTYENIEAELRAARVSDGLTDSSRMELLAPYMDTLASYGDGNRFTISFQQLSGYNVPELLVTYSEVKPKQSLSNTEAEQALPSEEALPSGDAQTRKPSTESTESSRASVESSSEAPVESSSSVSDGAESSVEAGAGSTDESSEESSSPVGDISYIPDDIGLNDEITSSVPSKTSFSPKTLISDLESAIKETDYGICYLKVIDLSGSIQIWYISDNVTLRLDNLQTDTPLEYNGDSVSGFKTGSIDGYSVYSGTLSNTHNSTDVADAYLSAISSISGDSIVCIMHKSSYLYYVSDTKKTTDFIKGLEGLTPDQISYRTIKFCAETQFMSSDFTQVFGAFRDKFETNR